MSGGSMDYLYIKVADAEFTENTSLRKAFREHLELVAIALKKIEWNDSGDGADGEDDAIRNCLVEHDYGLRGYKIGDTVYSSFDNHNNDPGIITDIYYENGIRYYMVSWHGTEPEPHDDEDLRL